MIKPSSVSPPLLRSAALLCCLLLMTSFGDNHTSQAQEAKTIHDDTAKAIKLYEAGDVKTAFNQLQDIVEEREDDADAWFYTGLAYQGTGNFLDASGAFEKVISLRPSDAQAHVYLASILVMGRDVRTAGALAKRAIELGVQNAEVHYVLGESNLEAGNFARALEEAEIALTLDSDCADAFLTKAISLRELGRERESADALSTFLAAKPNADDAELWREELGRLNAGLLSAKEKKDEPTLVVYNSSDVTTKARFLSKPSPEYTEKARKIQISGTVLLSMVLSSTGEVTDIRVIQRLKGGLTTEAVKAARRISFEPAIKDGKPVSQFARMEYNFNIY